MGSLHEYERKRDLERSDEPGAERGTSEGAPRFVIQKHDASTLHYDFRIEAEGVLKSWAVPKGPSTDPSEKRLSQPTEDHPLDYADFEGMISEDEYGAGSVVVWDTGTYRNLASDDENRPVPVEQQIETGHVKIWLDGQKLTGGYTLQRIGGGDNPRWLLIKMDDEAADRRRNPVSTQPESVLSGKTNADLEKEDAE